ncbi:MAG: TolC family protein [Cyclobacteriaceae bacterium]|nr:TolC family protein [Cyclobacteriaceae bacterium]
MYKKFVFASSVCLISIVVNAQTTDITRVLLEIEQNNKELQAYSSLMESKKFELKSGNNFPDPQVGAYYLPWGEHNSGDYTEFQVSQSFEFPTIYGVRKGLIEKWQGQTELEYASNRQSILLTAKKAILELVYLNKRITVEQTRVEQAKKVVEQVQELFEKEIVGILEVNKAKIAWVQEQFKVEQIETNKQNILLHLKNLNGGVEISFTQPNYVESLTLAEMDSIWENKKLSDPVFKILKLQEEVALEQIKLSKNESLPNLTTGFNYQGVSGSNYSGIYGGLSIPIWSNRHKVKAAKAKYLYQQFFSDAQSITSYIDFQKQYNDYLILLSKFQEYERTLNGINSDILLLEAYELGEISFMTYYIELQFYRQAYDSMLEMEKQLIQLKADILKHQL